MRLAFWISILALVASSGCRTRGDSIEGAGLTSAQRQAIEESVRRFVLDVARDVSQEGPTAWRKHFADSPTFFMGVDGQLAFADSKSAREGIQSFARTIQHIELRWGNEVRVDPLTAEFAVVATPWVEVQTDLKGQQATTRGFFTAIAQNRDGRWEFRDAHWSEPVAPAKNP